MVSVVSKMEPDELEPCVVKREDNERCEMMPCWVARAHDVGVVS